MSINELKVIITEEAELLEQSQIRRTISQRRNWVKLVVKYSGGHIEHAFQNSTLCQLNEYYKDFVRTVSIV